jgi:hypothetical protein
MACGAATQIEQAIRHAVAAGGLREYVRADERCAAGFNKAAMQHSALARGLLTEWAEGCRTLAGPPLAEITG